MHPNTRSILTDLVISHHETDGHPAVTMRDKNELRRYLTHVLVNDVTLSKHCEYLKSIKAPQPPLLPTETVNSIPNTGLDPLNNQELALLALDTLALETLFEDIDNRVPDAWLPAIKQEGLKLIPSKHEDDE